MKALTEAQVSASAVGMWLDAKQRHSMTAAIPPIAFINVFTGLSL
jgi:hypothetical protein